MRFAQNFEFRNSDLRRRRLGRRLNPRANQLIVLGYAVKPLESKETKASKEITVTHNSVFAAHRLQCRMTNRKNRHPAFCLYGKTNQESRKPIERRLLATPCFREGGCQPRKSLPYFSSGETWLAATCHRPSRLISVSVNWTTRSNGLPFVFPFTCVFPRTTAVLSPYRRPFIS